MAVLPGSFLDLSGGAGGATSPAVLSPVARELGVALLSTGRTADGTHAAMLIGPDGAVLLNRSASAASATGLECGGSSSSGGGHGGGGNQDGFAVARVPVAGGSGNATVAVGVLLDREWECFHGARVLMLRGAEVVLIAASDASPPPLSDGPRLALQTRAWENVLAVVLARGAATGGSQAYLGVKDTSDGVGVVLLEPTKPGSAVAAFDVDTVALQANRSVAIWGDAFRRPFAYRSLCGLAAPASAGGAAPKASAASAGAVASPSRPLSLSVALLQLSPQPTEAALADHAEAKVRAAAAQGADIAVMPEMYSVGYCHLCPVDPGRGEDDVRGLYSWADRAQRCDDTDGAPQQQQPCSGAPVNGSAFVLRFAALAKELGVAVQASFLRLAPAGGPPHNSVAIIDRHGEARLVYDKVHTAVWSQCETMTAPGNQFRVVSLDTAVGSVEVGAMICADREYPEAPRVLAEMGAELILVSNACVLTDWHLDMFRTRAWTSAVGVAMANYGGSVPADGRSCAYDPAGDEVAVGPAGVETTVVARFNLSALRELRASPQGRARLRPWPTPALCDPVKNPMFHAVNPLGRPMHSM